MSGIDTSAARYLWAGEGGQGSRGVDGGQEPAGHPAPRQAWLREMERAQLAGWFQPFSPGEASSAGARPVAAKPGTPSPAHAAPIPPAASAAAAIRSPVVRASPWQKPGVTPFPESVQKTPYGAGAVQHVTSESRMGDARSNARAGHNASGSVAASASSARGDVPGPRQATASMAYESSPAESSSAPAASMTAGAGPTSGKVGPDAGSGLPLVAKPFMDNAAVAWWPARLQPAVAPDLVMTLPRSAPAEFRGPAAAAVASSAGSEGRRGDPALALERQARSMGANPHMHGGNATGTRVYAQWTDAGALLWLGMDGAASQVGFQAAAIVPYLQRALREQGQRLLRVVCNGRVVFDAGMQTTTDFIAFPARSGGLSFSSIFQKGHP